MSRSRNSFLLESFGQFSDFAVGKYETGEIWTSNTNFCSLLLRYQVHTMEPSIAEIFELNRFNVIRGEIKTLFSFLTSWAIEQFLEFLFWLNSTVTYISIWRNVLQLMFSSSIVHYNTYLWRYRTPRLIWHFLALICVSHSSFNLQPLYHVHRLCRLAFTFIAIMHFSFIYNRRK